MAMQWTVVVPVKGFTQAKSRLSDEFATASTRGILAQAFVTDLLSTLRATEDVAHVIVVTGDARVAALAIEFDTEVVLDPGDGLNAAIVAATPRDTPVAVFLGDLPCVRVNDVAWALHQAAGHDRSFIPDAAGTGTTMLACTVGELTPRFGAHSAAAHAVSGAVRLEGAPAALHRDVDTEVDVWDAVRIGVGPATRQALATR